MDVGRHRGLGPATIAMSQTLANAALALLLPGLCLAQSSTPAEALDRYLNAARDRQPGCSEAVFAVQIDASLPRLKQRGSMSGLKLVSPTGQIVYRSLKFTGDSLIKTAVIARFLAHETDPPDPAADTGLTPRNYSILYDKTSEIGGSPAYVYRLKPKRKRVGLFRGELWLDAATGAPLRVSGDLVKSPSIFVRGFHFVQDYRDLNQCSQPVRLLLTVQTRIAGQAEMAVRLQSVDNPTPAAGGGACGSEGGANRDSGHE